MGDYTPTTEHVRNLYVEPHGQVVPAFDRAKQRTAREDQFDRWLAQHDAEVRTAALNAAADALPESTTPLGGPLAISPAVRVRVQEWLRAQAGGAA